MPWTAVASEMRPYQSDLRENALLSDAILPAYRSSNGSRTSNSLPIKRFHHQFLETVHKYLRMRDLCKELGIFFARA